MLVQGPVEQAIIRQATRSGKALPEKIANAPSVLPGLDLYWQAFMDLMASRMTGMGIGPIWWGTVQEYCVCKRLDEEQTEAMHYHIRMMDTVYLKWANKKK